MKFARGGRRRADAPQANPNASRARRAIENLVVAILAYVPFFLSQPGRVSADTKAYLYLNPGHLLATASSMWNADQGFGFVTHQNIGYLFPMGPYFWFAHALAIPTWMAQRFWMGSLLFLAAVGVRKAAQEFGLSRRAAWVAALAYMLTPFILVNIGRTSALLMPWAGLGWMMVAVMRATRRPGWRDAALFALVVALTGGINATSILLVGLGPVIWLLQQAWSKAISWRLAATIALKIGVLSALVSLWWLAGLWVEGKFGINILQFTESIPTVTGTSTSSEVFRGLGYWYFYGLDHIQPWTQSSTYYVSSYVIPLLSYGVPLLGATAAILVRWRGRSFAGVLVFVGVIIAVGAYPFSHPTPFGSLLKWLADNTTAGLAMRSLNRIVPLIIFGLVLSLAAGVDALRERQRPDGRALAFVSVSLAIVGLFPVFAGQAIAKNLTAPSSPPQYVRAIAGLLNQSGVDTGVLGLPGLDFGYYNYGTYGDQIWPGLLNRPFVTSQVVLQGEGPSVNLVRALDETFQNGVANPNSVAPIARLLNAGDVLVQYDGQFDRFAQPGPAYVENVFARGANGLTLLRAAGPRVSDKVRGTNFVNEYNLSLPTNFVWPRSLAVYRVDNPIPLVRTETASNPLIVAGDGQGLVHLANLRLLTTNSNQPIFYSAALDAQERARLAREDPTLVLTDTNQLRYDTFGTLVGSQGYVAAANEPAPPSVNDLQPNEPFGVISTNEQTVAENAGVKLVYASSYGNPISATPEDAPYHAIDANSQTSWETSAFSNADGQWIQIDALAAHRLSAVTVQQSQSPIQNRFITAVRVSLSNGYSHDFQLDQRSRTSSQTLRFAAQLTSTLRLTILRTTSTYPLRLTTSVGFAEITAKGFGPVFHSLRLPTALLARFPKDAARDPLAIVLSRIRATTLPPRHDAEQFLSRSFTLPAARTFSLTGLASINPLVDDSVIESLAGGLQGSGTHVVATRSSSRIVGSLATSSWNLFDGSSETSWQPSFRNVRNQVVEFSFNRGVTIGSFSLSIVNDGRHSVPQAFTLSNRTTSDKFTLATPVASPSATRNATQTFTFSGAPLTGRTFSLEVTKVKQLYVTDRVSGGVNVPPFGLAEITIPGVTNDVHFPSHFNSGCRRDLLVIDGRPVGVQIGSSLTNALALSPLDLAACNSEQISLSKGTHVLFSAPGLLSGLNIDDLALTSLGASLPEDGTIHDAVGHWTTRSSVRATVGPNDGGRWLVLAQSDAQGWHASLNGKDLGSPTLIDGGAMGWLLPRTVPPHAIVAFTWAPQQSVVLALALSALGLALVLYLLLSKRRRAPLGPIEPANATLLGTTQAGSTRRMLLLGVFAGLAVSYWLLPVTIVFALWLRGVRRMSALVIAPALGLLAGAALVTTYYAHALRMHDYSWPSSVPYANGLAWCGLALWFIVVVGLDGPRRSLPNTPSETEVASDDNEPPTRRRGLNMPTVTEPVPAIEQNPGQLFLPPVGLMRTFVLARAALSRRRNPESFTQLIAADTINQMVGRVPIYNRDVLEIADTATNYGKGLAERGARVVRMRREEPPTRRGTAVSPVPLFGDEIAYSPLHIPAADSSFDVVFATNILSSVEHPDALMRELLRVVRPGGSVYIQNVLWYSPLGGRETSPWHLISGSFARARYARRHASQPTNRYGVNFFKLTAGAVLRLVHDVPNAVVVSASPRYLSSGASWMLRVPALRNLSTFNIVVILERSV